MTRLSAKLSCHPPLLLSDIDSMLLLKLLSPPPAPVPAPYVCLFAPAASGAGFEGVSCAVRAQGLKHCIHMHVAQALYTHARGYAHHARSTIVY
jgi:hypothetical protein